MTEIQQHIEHLIQEMTLDEKIHLLNGGRSFSSFPIERLGIPSIQFLDGGTGMNWEQLMGDWMELDAGTMRQILTNFNHPECLTEEQQKIRMEFIHLLDAHHCITEQPGCYPPGILLGATWNPQVVYECGQALGQEALDYHVDILLGTPNVNLHRDPLNGRLFEGYSEDPCLIRTLAPELVKGVQESGVLANVKHFAANNLEAYRQGVDEHISERVLQELYLPGFRACVEEGQVKTLMTAYNKINGIPCTEHKWLLQTVLRQEWGFDDRLIISDWGAVYNQPEALHAGNDIDMPGPRDQSAVYAAIEEGTLTEAELNLAVSHMLTAIFQTPAGRAGLSSAAAVNNTESGSGSQSFKQKAAYDAVTEGAVLLKNQSRTLPFKSNSRIALIGEETIHFHDCGDGSARVYTNKTTSLLDELSDDRNYQCQYIEQISQGCLNDYDYGILTVFVPGQEGRDRSSLSLSSSQQKKIQDAIREGKKSNTRLILILNVCGPVDLQFCEEDLDAILCIFFPGMEGGRGVKDILTGRVNPSGKLPLTFPKRLEDCPTYLNQPSPDWTLNYGEGLYVGYRYYDKKGIEPLYPFGYGLSYTQFRLSNLESACSPTLALEDTICLTCQLTNIGSRAGSEVVQLYANDVSSTLDKPIRELKAFQKVYLEPAESRTLTFRLPVQALASFDPVYKKWLVEPGEYRFYIGSSSRHLEEPVTLIIEGTSDYDFHGETPFIRILEHSTAYQTLLTACRKYQITESDFQGFAVYTPYFSLERVLNGVLGWKLKDDTLTAAKEEVYQLLRQVPAWKH
ncbi:MAG: glycoside hydrolase family 3 C-terminal domain-containing protein [Lachnospiraceae bacterium]|nr:glycoside hydrolase family 3 C-terminal domain-containing protein [Lachnospiraceae bacterium]